MNRSETITKISVALVKAQSEMSNAVKDATNPFFNKKYADLNAIREACLPVLNKHGISAIQPTCVVDGINYVETILLHESGEYISSLTPIITASITDPQKHGSGLSYARRYALQSIVNIGAEDDDANKAMPQMPPASSPTVPPPVKPTYTAADLTAANKSLTACKDFASLSATWTALSPELKVATAAKKDELKAKFAKPVA
jgi:hypothetical protein